MNPINVIDERIKNKQIRDPEGTIVQAYITSVRVQPRGSTRTIMCDCDNANFTMVGKRCTYSKPYGSKKYIITEVYPAPNQTNFGNRDAGTSQSDHSLHDNIAGEISRIQEKTSLVDDDYFLINDSEDGNRPKALKASHLTGGTSTRFEPLIFDDDIVIFDHDIVMVEVVI